VTAVTLEHRYEPRGTAARECSVDGCSRAHYAKGYCNPHWRRWKVNGTPGTAEIGSYGGGTCTFDGCDKDASAKELCPTHYAQQRRGGHLAPINDRVAVHARDAAGNKRCPTCKQWQPVTAFGTWRRNPDGLASSCLACVRERVFRRRYGITSARYDELLAAQGGGCAICRGVNESGRAMAVDHDHACCAGAKACGRCVRGLLCSNCNLAIGLLREDPVRLAAAIDYLGGHRGRNA
jgi:hypothetical protein